MNELVDMLREAFEAGQQNATEYENGSKGYHPDFKKWYKLNKKEIEQLHRLLMLSDGHRQYRKSDDEDPGTSSNHGDRHSGWRIYVAIPIHELPKKAGWYNMVGDCNPDVCGRMWFDGKDFNVPTNWMNVTLYWLSETEIA